MPFLQGVRLCFWLIHELTLRFSRALVHSSYSLGSRRKNASGKRIPEALLATRLRRTQYENRIPTPP